MVRSRWFARQGDSTAQDIAPLYKLKKHGKAYITEETYQKVALFELLDHLVPVVKFDVVTVGRRVILFGRQKGQGRSMLCVARISVGGRLVVVAGSVPVLLVDVGEYAAT